MFCSNRSKPTRYGAAPPLAERQAMKKTLVTGATGGLGQLLLSRLVAEGYSVYVLARDKARLNASERISRLMEPHGGMDNVHVIEGDIRDPLCGVADTDIARMRNEGIDFVLHSAASINFQDVATAQSTNINGVTNALALADELGVTDFQHVSTAYVCGDAKRFSEQEVSVGQASRNVYEQTKLIGEMTVRAWASCRRERRFTIFRPSVLVGRVDGSMPIFDTYSLFFRPLHVIAERYRSRGDRRLPPDIRVSEGWVNLPLCIVMANVRVNYVPVDWVVDMMALLLRHASNNLTFHLTHTHPIRMLDGLSRSLDYLKLRGLNVVPTLKEKRSLVGKQSQLVQRLQSQVDAIHDPYLPYCTTEQNFVSENARRLLGSLYREPPMIDEAYIERMLAFAEARNWSIG
jgi:nucleoside-diphosphate-sugar epimerase